MDFFSRSNPDYLDLAVRRNGARQFHDVNARNARDKNLAILHRLDGPDDELRSLLQGKAKASPPPIGDLHFAARALIDESGNHAATCPDDVAIPDTTERDGSAPIAAIRFDEELFREQFGCPVGTDRAHGFIRADV